MNSIDQRLSGVFTALVTPFEENGSLDLDALDALINAQLAAGVAGLVPVGTTGEAPTLNDAERTQVIQRTVDRAAGKAFVLAGTGANDTTKAVAWTRQAEELGVDGCLVVAPYYNKPTQQGLLAYFGAVAECTSLPIVLYSVPGRCGIEIAADTAAALHHKYSNIVGIKEAGGTVDRVTEIRKSCGKDFLIQSGDDGLTLPFLAVGAIGVISVVSNLAPELMIDLLAAWREGRTDDARDIHDRVSNLASAMFIESSPVPVKAALAMDGRMQSTVRSPLVPLSSSGLEYLKTVLASS
jgi:4-hydroxy-tetrahydrodipicolinate synthase